MDYILMKDLSRVPSGTSSQAEGSTQAPLPRSQPSSINPDPPRRRPIQYIFSNSVSPSVAKRNYRIFSGIGICLASFLIIGTIFGVVIAFVLSKGANPNVDLGGPNSSDMTTIASGIVTTISSVFTTMVLSDTTTMVPTQITVFVPSDMATLVPSLVTSVITAERHGYHDPIGSVDPIITPSIKEGNQVISTLSTLTLTTVAVSSTTFGYAHQGLKKINGVSLRTCDGRGSNNCVSATSKVKIVLSDLVGLLDLGSAPSALKVACGDGVQSGCMSVTSKTQIIPSDATSLPDLESSATPLGASVAGGLKTMVTLTAHPLPTSDSGHPTSYSMMCDVAAVSTLAPCNPVPTSWYISASAPRSTSFLHSVFRFFFSIPGRIKTRKSTKL